MKESEIQELALKLKAETGHGIFTCKKELERTGFNYEQALIRLKGFVQSITLVNTKEDPKITIENFKKELELIQAKEKEIKEAWINLIDSDSTLTKIQKLEKMWEDSLLELEEGYGYPNFKMPFDDLIDACVEKKLDIEYDLNDDIMSYFEEFRLLFYRWLEEIDSEELPLVIYKENEGHTTIMIKKEEIIDIIYKYCLDNRIAGFIKY